MKQFKLLRNPLFTAHDGGDIYVGDVFYTMNKEDIGYNDFIPKYTIVRRRIHLKFRDTFKPNHELLWYFRSKRNAEWCRKIWLKQDKIKPYTNQLI